MSWRPPSLLVLGFMGVFAALVVTTPAVSRADEPDLTEARDQFKRGAELAKDAQWAAALAAFERSAKLKPHAWTTYNIGVCERALGQYVRARKTFTRALEQRGKDGELPDSTALDIQKFQGEIGALVATLDITIEPSDARIAVDGQPLEVVSRDGERPVALAGTLAAGTGRQVPAADFRVLLDPGHHVFVIAREGFSDAVHAEDVRPGDRRALHLSLDRLPATLHVAADRTNAVVTVDDLDVGVAPVTLLRPAGKHRVLVRRAGFLPYETDAVVRPGQRVELVANLREDKPSLLSRWWFWTAAGVVVTGAALTTYALTRPEPERPAVNGGGLDWTVRAP
ncbi:TonB-dependent receptor [Labilithrix luteola]|uniref:TonB-dependent receptor n=1 Tax=Labilithrix luteola TaxID=1391654 RepID=A0A0K1QAX5_9BACT|nr:PEGA domain-containing protein [Labilithrix luteola]AKV02889.1 TonB-dependent receptor [Labilithrix luteola]